MAHLATLPEPAHSSERSKLTSAPWRMLFELAGFGAPQAAALDALGCCHHGRRRRRAPPSASPGRAALGPSQAR